MSRAGAWGSRWAIAVVAVGALAVTACSDDANDDVTDGVAEDAAADEGADDGVADEDTEEAVEAGGDEPATARVPDGWEPANGSLTVDGEELPLEIAYQCPARELYEGDGEIVFHAYAFGAEQEYGVNAWEQVEGGVTSHRVSADAPGLSLMYEHVAEEGGPDYPLIEVDGDRINVRARPGGADGEVPEIRAAWDLPANMMDAMRC